jgi:hypothetical protein
MHSSIKFLLLFIPALFLGDRAIAAALSHVTLSSHDRYVKVYTGRAPADVLIVGNSRADNHFPPALLEQKAGVKAVNLGLGGVSLVIAEALVQDYIDHNGRPKLLIVEPSALTVDPAVIGDMRLFAAYSERMSGLVRHYMPKFHYAAKVFHTFQYNNEMFLRAAYNVVKPPTDRLHEGTIHPALMEVLKNRGAYSLVNYPDNEPALTRLVKLAEQQGVQVAVVLSPYLPVQLGKIKNYDAWRAQVAKLVGSHARVLDYGGRVQDTAMFMDGVHLNGKGSERLLDMMVEDGVFRAATGTDAAEPPAPPVTPEPPPAIPGIARAVLKH